MLLVVTVAGWLTLEVMTLHRSCETFSAAYSSDVNAVANGELVDGDFLANLKGIDRIEADFDAGLWTGSVDGFGFQISRDAVGDLVLDFTSQQA